MTASTCSRRSTRWSGCARSARCSPARSRWPSCAPRSTRMCRRRSTTRSASTSSASSCAPSARSSPSSTTPAMAMGRPWVDWLLALPWVAPPAETLDIERAAAILDEDHYGLTKVKDRILEWLAVRERIRAKSAEAEAAAAEQKIATAADVDAADQEAGGGAGGSVDLQRGKRQDEPGTQAGSDTSAERRGVPATTGPAARQ